MKKKMKRMQMGGMAEPTSSVHSRVGGISPGSPGSSPGIAPPGDPLIPDRNINTRPGWPVGNGGGMHPDKSPNYRGGKGRGAGLPRGLAKRAPADMPKGLMNRPGGMPPGLKPKPVATMKKGGMVMRGSGCATKGTKISKKMG